MSARRGVIAVLLLATSLAACGSSQPSSAVEEASPTSQPSTAAPSSDAAASTEPSTEPTASSEPASSAVALKEPPKPGNPTFKHVDTKPGPKKFTFTETYKLTWTEPKGAAESFLIYGMPDCARYSKEYNKKPCVVRGMPIDLDELTLLATVPGDQRSTTVSWDIGEVDVPPYWAILIRAANDAGNSIFTIAKSYDVCFRCVY